MPSCRQLVFAKGTVHPKIKFKLWHKVRTYRHRIIRKGFVFLLFCLFVCFLKNWLLFTSIGLDLAAALFTSRMSEVFWGLRNLTHLLFRTWIDNVWTFIFEVNNNILILQTKQMMKQETQAGTCTCKLLAWLSRGFTTPIPELFVVVAWY